MGAFANREVVQVRVVEDEGVVGAEDHLGERLGIVATRDVALGEPVLDEAREGVVARQAVPELAVDDGAWAEALAALSRRAGRSSVLHSDSLTLNAGAGLRILLGRTFYLRPVVRARWFESRDRVDDLDLEYTLALGFRFGC